MHLSIRKRTLRALLRGGAYFAYASVIFTAPLGAQSKPQNRERPVKQDTAAIIATVQRFFDGMAQHDTVALRATLLPGTRFITLLNDTTGTATPRTQIDTSFFRTVATRPERLVERMWSPRVLIDGPIATLSTAYDFHMDTTWSHCGIDTFTLMRSAGTWRIVTLAYTVQRVGCPPAPAMPGR